MSRVAGIVLAAGASRRLGRPKQLLMLDGMPIVAHVVDRALASRLDEVVVVTGAHGERIRAALRGRAVQLIENPRYEQGQGTSLGAGVSALGDTVDAVVVLLADQPGILTMSIDRVIEARRDSSAPIVMARYGHDRGHPVLFGRELFPELERLTADIGGREIVQAHGDAVVLVDMGSALPPLDVDTEEAWAELQRAWPAVRVPAQRDQ